MNEFRYIGKSCFDEKGAFEALFHLRKLYSFRVLPSSAFGGFPSLAEFIHIEASGPLRRLASCNERTNEVC